VCQKCFFNRQICVIGAAGVRYDHAVTRTRTFVIPYVLSLVVVIALLVVWVVYAIQSGGRLHEFAGRLGVTSPRSPWIILAVGCALFALLIVFVTHQLARSLAEYRYARKQEEFVSGITHEMRSPLAAIQLHAETLSQEETDPDSRRSLDYILREAHRLGRLIDNVLESSRLVARKQAFEPNEVPVEPFCDQFFSEIRPSVEGRNLILETKISTDASILATDEALRRVLTNLVENAVRYSVSGNRVWCRVFERGPRVVFQVTDEGIGIPKSELSLIFDRFYRIGRDTHAEHGTGLGLFIVSQLVEQMRGSVCARSRDSSSGTTFEVEVPVMENI